jgi:hypothetical protein
VYMFKVLELEKRIKMTHICPTLTLSPGPHRIFLGKKVIHE